MDEAKNQINDLEQKEAKNNNQNNKKEEESRTQEQYKAAFKTPSSIPPFASQGCQEEKRKSKKWETCVEKNERKLP